MGNTSRVSVSINETENATVRKEMILSIVLTYSFPGSSFRRDDECPEEPKLSVWVTTKNGLVRVQQYSSSLIHLYPFPKH